MNESEWENVFLEINSLLRTFSTHSKKPSTTDIVYMYIDKTYERLSTYIKHNSLAREVHSRGRFRVNGRVVECPLRYFEKHTDSILTATTILLEPFTIIHGDLCCSNILYDRNRRKIFLIDPRGSFGQKGVFGDQRYDRAKMRHSFSGYDLIVHDFVSVRWLDSSLDFDIPKTRKQQRLARKWDSICKNQLEAIRIIEALLFLSMLPLHQDQPQRQAAMYGLGTQLLHESLA